MLKKYRWHLETFLFMTVSRCLARLPQGGARSAGKWLGRFFFLLLKRRREVAVRNITESLPFLERQPGWVPRPARELARETFENLGRTVVEVCKLYHDRGASLIESVEYHGREHFEAAMARGKGVLMVTGHCGNWELMALSFGVRHQNVTIVAKRQENHYLNGVLEKVRERYGNSLIYREGALRGMRAVFKNNGVVGLLIDQASSPKDGVLVDFVGRPAWTNKVVATLARRAEVTVLPVFIHREGEKQVVEIQPMVVLEGEGEEPGELRDIQLMTRWVEEYVIKHPTEWYWIHQRWKRVPPQAARCEGAAVEDCC